VSLPAAVRTPAAALPPAFCRSEVIVSFASNWRRLGEITWRDRLLLIEAMAALAVASVAIRAMPFRKVVGSAAGEAPRAQPNPQVAHAHIDRARWAVTALAGRLPWRIVCFQKGLALHRLLRRRGVATRLHYGIAQDEERGLRAHVWVTYDGAPVIGGAEAVEYTCLATFPPSAASDAAAVPR